MESKINEELSQVNQDMKDLERQIQRLKDKKEEIERKKLKYDYVEQFSDTYWKQGGCYVYIKSVDELIAKQYSISYTGVRLIYMDYLNEYELDTSGSLHHSFFDGMKDKLMDGVERTVKITKEEFDEFVNSVLKVIDDKKAIYEEIRDNKEDDHGSK